MAIKSNSKGSQFERDVCRKLSLWVSDNKDDDLFWRSASSGGRATQRSKTGRRTANQYGDITATHPDGAELLKIFTFELKKGYSKISMQDLLDRPKTASHELVQWQKQALKSSLDAGTQHYAIIWQRDRCQPLVLVGWNTWLVLRRMGMESYAHIVLRPTGWQEKFAAFHLDTFLSFDYDYFIQNFGKSVSE